MPPFITPADLDAQDLVVLRDLVRFGVLTADQIARRYADESLASLRIPLLRQGRAIVKWRDTLDGEPVYSPTTFGNRLVNIEVDPFKTREGHLGHDVALVDLADLLVAQKPGREWRTERELRRVLDAIGPPPHFRPGDNRHRPDGLLLENGERIAVELEHSDKFEERYTRISRWFAREYRLDRVRWYVDRPRIIRRLRDINHDFGFARDIPIEIEPFPPGVVIRKRPDRFER